jgi:hypothetical protein
MKPNTITPSSGCNAVRTRNEASSRRATTRSRSSSAKKTPTTETCDVAADAPAADAPPLAAG